MKCGGSTKKMAKGGSVSKPFAAGIPYATGAGATDGKNGMMKKGGAVKKMQKGGVSGEELRNRGIDMKIAGMDARSEGSALKGYGKEMKAIGKNIKAKGMAKKADGKTLKAAGQILGRMKSGGIVKNAKLAALAAPKNKITRADVIVGAKRNAKKK